MYDRDREEQSERDHSPPVSARTTSLFTSEPPPPATTLPDREDVVNRAFRRAPRGTPHRNTGLVCKDDGWRLPDWLWAQIEPLLPLRPSHPLGCHRSRVPDRAAMNAILLVLRTGMR